MNNTFNLTSCSRPMDLYREKIVNKKPPKSRGYQDCFTRKKSRKGTALKRRETEPL